MPTAYVKKSEGDPIDCIDGDWGFWDETWSHWYGGYSDEDAANKGLDHYVATQL